MRALIIATGPGVEEGVPAALLTLVDRPFVQHVVEALVDQGITGIDIAVDEGAERVEREVGSGVRWGTRLRYHLVSDGTRPYSVLRRLDWPADEPILLATADRLPRTDLAAARPRRHSRTPAVFVCAQGAGGAGVAETTGATWTGWAWVPHDVAVQIPGGASERDVARILTERARGRGTVAVNHVLSARSGADLLASQAALLNGGSGEIDLYGRERAPGIRLAHGSRVHESARLLPPVFVGANSRIGAGARVGPNVVVGADCILDTGCVVEEALVGPQTYVGGHLYLRRVIARGNRVLDLRHGTALSVPDEFLVGDLSEPTVMAWLASAWARCAAALLLAVLWPAALAAAVARAGAGPLLRTRRVVCLPAPADGRPWRTHPLHTLCPEWDGSRQTATSCDCREWRHLACHFVPGLVSVVRGHLRFVGVTPRTPEQVEVLPADWRRLYLSARAGLVTETSCLSEVWETEYEESGADAYQAMHSGPVRSARLLWAYCGRLFPPGGPSTLRIEGRRVSPRTELARERR